MRIGDRGALQLRSIPTLLVLKAAKDRSHSWCAAEIDYRPALAATDLLSRCGIGANLGRGRPGLLALFGCHAAQQRRNLGLSSVAEHHDPHGRILTFTVPVLCRCYVEIYLHGQARVLFLQQAQVRH
jgi:hypothetical protein